MVPNNPYIYCIKHESLKLKFYKSVGDLECSGACLSERWKVDGQGTLEGPGLVLLLVAPPAAAPPTEPPFRRARTPIASPPLAILYAYIYE
jgi:hypothetical protein